MKDDGPNQSLPSLQIFIQVDGLLLHIASFLIPTQNDEITFGASSLIANYLPFGGKDAYMKSRKC